MIKNLNGVREKVDYEEMPGLLLYDNTQYEEYPNHWHSSLEIIMPLEGCYQVECNLKTYELKEGDVLIIAPGTIHRLKAEEGRRIIIQADFTGGNILGNMNEVFTVITPAIMISKSKSPSLYDVVRQHMMTIYSEYGQSQPMRGLAIMGHLMQMLTIVGRECSISMKEPIAEKSNYQHEQIAMIMNTCTYINEHCTENLTLEGVAALAGFSKYHFSRRFKEIVGVSFYKYLNGCRISRAEQLLLNPQNSVTDVFLQSGFNSNSSFIRMFKIVNGCTPNEFRKMKQDE